MFIGRHQHFCLIAHASRVDMTLRTITLKAYMGIRDFMHRSNFRGKIQTPHSSLKLWSIHTYDIYLSFFFLPKSQHNKTVEPPTSYLMQAAITTGEERSPDVHTSWRSADLNIVFLATQSQTTQQIPKRNRSETSNSSSTSGNVGGKTSRWRIRHSIDCERDNQFR